MSPKIHNAKRSASKNIKGEKEISLNYYFDWYEKAFCEKLSKAGSEFLSFDINFKLVGISDSVNSLLKDSDYFVTQVGVSKEHSVTIKISDTAANLIFKNALGDRANEKGSLKLKNITELEAKILTAFNEFLYKKISDNFLTPKEIRSIEYELNNEEKNIYLVFYISGNTDDEAGKIVFIFPEFILKNIIHVKDPETALDIDYFSSSLVETDIIAGYSRITLEDVKNLDLEDIVILEKSNLYSMILKSHKDLIAEHEGETSKDNKHKKNISEDSNSFLKININPDPNIVINLEEDNGEDAVSKVTGNIWDSLEVDLSAEFEKVKIRLGDLRHVVEGLVIDIAPIAENKLYLNVEGKQVAAGELVIIGDKYGVKVTEVYSDAKKVKHAPAVAVASHSKQDSAQNESYKNNDSQVQEEQQDEIDESDFDFSDYEIEDDV